MELTGNVQGIIDLMGGGSSVEVAQVLTSGEKIATISVDDVPTDIYAPSPTAPTDVEVTQVVSSGTKIATISVDDVPTDIYAPSSIIYSTEEREAGIWIDEPLFQKTWIFSNNITIASNQWTDTPISNTGIRDIISVEGLNDEGTAWTLSGARTISGDYVQVYSFRNATLQVNRITLRYTKST